MYRQQLIILGDRTASNSNTNLIAKQTQGICFLGTPFLGSDKAKWANMLLTFLSCFAVKTQRKNVEDMKPNSAALVELNEAFFAVLQKRGRPDYDGGPVEIACFFEAHLTRGAVSRRCHL